MAMGMDNSTGSMQMPSLIVDDVPMLWRLNIICNATLDVVITGFVALRCYVIFSSRIRLQPEDWMCICAWLLTLIYTGPMFTMTRYGIGYPVASVSPGDFISFKKALYAASATYSPAAISTKTTLLLMTARVFGSKPRISKGIYTFIGLLVLMFLPIQICKVAICTPVEAFWDESIQDKKCLNQGILFLCDSMIAVLSDLAILVLPVYLTWSLSVPVTKKLKISILLGAGGIGVGLTAYRLYKSWLYSSTTDLTVDYVPIAILSTGELSIGIICACLPSVNILLERGTSKQGAGQNRQGNIGVMGKQRSSRGSSKFSSWISSKLSTTHASSTTGDQFTIGLDHTTIHQVNVDVELGTITEMAGEEDLDITRGQGRSGRARVLSMDGRREGWLAPSAGQKGGAPKGKSSSGTGSNAVPSSEVVFVGESGPRWDFIWDGRRTTFTETRLQELRHERPP